MNKSDWIDYNLDMINFFIHELLKFINKYNKEFNLNTDLETFYDNFSNFLYNNYYLDLEFKDNINYDKNYEYFESMYEDDIIDLFSEFKEISYGFNSDIFRFRNESYSLLEFIYYNINLEENYNVLNDDVEEEYVEEEYY
jgi:hypothetical protein